MDDEEDEDDEDEYQVEKIEEHNFVKGKVIYKVKWLGYDEEDDKTWEPIENLYVLRSSDEEALADFTTVRARRKLLVHIIERLAERQNHPRRARSRPRHLWANGILPKQISTLPHRPATRKAEDESLMPTVLPQ